VLRGRHGPRDARVAPVAPGALNLADPQSLLARSGDRVRLTSTGLRYVNSTGLRTKQSRADMGSSERATQAGGGRRAPTCGACRDGSPDIERSDSAPRVRAARSVPDASALAVHATRAGVGVRHDSRRGRPGTSGARCPACGAGRRRPTPAGLPSPRKGSRSARSCQVETPDPAHAYRGHGRRRVVKWDERHAPA
jgi:hypothetical protein